MPAWFHYKFKIFIYLKFILSELSVYKNQEQKPCIIISVIDRTISFQNSYVEAPRPQKMTAFGDKAFKEVIKLRWGS